MLKGATILELTQFIILAMLGYIISEISSLLSLIIIFIHENSGREHVFIKFCFHLHIICILVIHISAVRKDMSTST